MTIQLTIYIVTIELRLNDNRSQYIQMTIQLTIYIVTNDYTTDQYIELSIFK